MTSVNVYGFAIPTVAFVAAALAGSARSDAQQAAARVGAGDDWIAPGGDAGKMHFSRLFPGSPGARDWFPGA